MDSLGLLGRFKDLFSFKITNSFSGDSFKNIFSTILRGHILRFHTHCYKKIANQILNLEMDMTSLPR